jgi:hypothetical protein
MGRGAHLSVTMNILTEPVINFFNAVPPVDSKKPLPRKTKRKKN